MVKPVHHVVASNAARLNAAVTIGSSDSRLIIIQSFPECDDPVTRPGDLTASKSPSERMSRVSPAIISLLVLLAACGGSDPVPTDPCDGTAAISLGAGDYVVTDPAAASGCLVLPGGGAAGAEYLVAAIGTSGVQVTSGVSGPFSLSSGTGQLSASRQVAAARTVSSDAGPVPDAAFHARLRAIESHLPASRVELPGPRIALAVTRPVVGDKRVFSVCATTACEGFVQLTATAQYVGTNGAIYVDDTIPAGGLTPQDIADVGALFDTYMYGIDTTAFGHESDLDNNGVVIILLSDAVNALSGTCADGTVILGYFLGIDLAPAQPGSNAGEIFYSRVPDPSTPSCNNTRARVLSGLAPTFIHEFQHMISFNQHVLVRGGSAEHVWLNEGLSHFAEELGGRLIPDGPAQGDAATRQSQFLQGNIFNASSYLESPASYYLVVPGGSLGFLGERGAQWLFVRWLADQFDGGDVRGTTLTRALVQTSALGSDNVAARTGTPFDQLVGAWQLANYLDNLDGFNAVAPRLQYLSVNLRATLAPLYPVFPLRPDSTSGKGYARSGTLRAGSGQQVRVVLPAGSGPVSLRLRGLNGQAIESLLSARYAVARIR